MAGIVNEFLLGTLRSHNGKCCINAERLFSKDLTRDSLLALAKPIYYRNKLRLSPIPDSYDDNQVMYRWSKVSLTEKDMTEFYVVKEILRLEATSFITGTSGTFSCFLSAWIPKSKTVVRPN